MTSAEAPATSHHSVCPLDCADTCSLAIEVAGGRVQKVRGSDANPFTRGKICAKVAQGLPDQQNSGPGPFTEQRHVGAQVIAKAGVPVGINRSRTRCKAGQ